MRAAPSDAREHDERKSPAQGVGARRDHGPRIVANFGRDDSQRIARIAAAERVLAARPVLRRSTSMFRELVRVAPYAERRWVEEAVLKLSEG